MSLHVSFGDWNDFSEGLNREWIETNHLGGYASSSITGCHTRKYHGLLNVHIPELSSKFLLLSKLGLSVNLSGQMIDLDTNKYPMTFHPKGYECLKSFSSHIYPTTTYFIEERSIEIDQSIMMVRGQNTTLIRYRIKKSRESVHLKFHPLLAFREIHGLTRENPYLDPKIERIETNNGDVFYKATPYKSMLSLYFGGAPIECQTNPYWLYNVEYSQEAVRGFNYQEDLYCPSILEKELSEGEEFIFCFSTDIPDVKASELWAQEEALRISEYKKASKVDEVIKNLIYSGEKFIIDSKVNGVSIIAGYPWFSEWGRDTMIALPGLTICRGEFDLGIDILNTYAKYQKDGLLPSSLPLGHGDAPTYNSIDSSLLFFWTLNEFARVSNKRELIKDKFFNVMTKIIDAYTDEKIDHARLRSNGLIWSGDEKNLLTWMDASAYGHAVTPRFGYAVEINALWYNALGFYLDLGGSDIDPETHANLTYLYELAGRSFVEVFWDDEKGYLADVVNEQGRDFSIRPNQIFAASLTFSPLSREQKQSIIKIVKKHLLTPVGLRTLDPSSPDYHPVYQGSPEERNLAYHQGTVWPWLLGQYVDAIFNCEDNLVGVKNNLRAHFEEFMLKHSAEYGIDSIAEIFDGDEPHKPNGAIAQAWSVGELIRSYLKLKSNSSSDGEKEVF